CDNAEAGFLLADHLARLGHRSVAFAGGPEESQDTQNRLRGLSEGLQEHGIAQGLEQIWFCQSYYASAGIEYAERYLALPERQRPTAVVLASDAMALGFLGSMQRHGVAVPEAVSVAGFDGVPEGELIWPRLTSVLQPTRTMAANACRVLLER